MKDQSTNRDLDSKWAALKRPFSLDEIRVKVLATTKDRSRGLIVPYIDARAVMDRLDEVATEEGWTDRYDVLSEGAVRCQLTIFGVSKEDVGMGEDPKGAFSDALKRTAVKFGIGRHLYDCDKLWGPLDERGQISDPEEAKRRVLGLGPERSQISPPARPQRPVKPAASQVPIHDDLPF